MEDNKDKMTGLDFDLDAITSQVDKAKKETHTGRIEFLKDQVMFQNIFQTYI